MCPRKGGLSINLAFVNVALALAFAFGLDRLGEPPARWHPVVWLGRYLAWVKGQKEGLEPPRSLFWRGAALLLLGCLGVGALAGFVQWALYLLPLWASVPLTASLLKPSFSLFALTKAGHEVRRAFESRRPRRTRAACSAFTWSAATLVT